jgi:branched-chain amino acid transport system ATP-binding protein
MERILQVHDLSVQYGPVKALMGVDLHAVRGEIVTLLGSNGAGKSTLMRSLIGLVSTQTGEIEFEGRRIEKFTVDSRVKLGIATVLEGRGMLPRMTVYENLQMGAYLRPNETCEKDFENVFSTFPALRKRVKQLAGTLSGGEQQMLAFGRALMLRPKLILMDEPSMGLAPVVVEKLFDAIVRVNKSGTTVVLVEQNARMALSIAHRFYVVSTGNIVLRGSVDGEKLFADRGNGRMESISEGDLEAAYLEGH